MVGLFFADLASAKDMGEFILPAFGILRICNGRFRREYSKNNFHAEVLWIPVPTSDEPRLSRNFKKLALRSWGGYFGSGRLDCLADLIKAIASIRSCKSRFKCCYSGAAYLEPPDIQTLGKEYGLTR